MRLTLARQAAITILLVSFLPPGLAAATTNPDEDPRPVLPLPFLNPEYSNPCDPLRSLGQPRSPMSSDAFMSAKIGQADPGDLYAQIMSDMLGVQAVCEGLVFVPGRSITRGDGSSAVVYHNKPGPTGASVSIGYFVQRGTLLRLSMWVSAEGDLDRSYAHFKWMITGKDDHN